MFLHGIKAHKNVLVNCISARAIAHSNSKKKFLVSKRELVDDIVYQYIPIINFRILRNVLNVFFGFIYSFKEISKIKNKKDVFFISDPLAFEVTLGTLLATKLFKIKNCAIITDLPTFMVQINKDGKGVSVLKRIKSFFINLLIDSFDSYVFLTKSMNFINKKNKPYVIIEGMTYSSDQPITSNHIDNNVMLYAGGLYEQFGIKKLIDAAKNVKIPNFELHLYGEGNCIDFIHGISQKFPNIKYMGTLTLDKILEKETKAKVLINPRPSTEKFTEYSFPSKTIEYMSAARPVLTTPLKGIPDEYHKYLLFIQDESLTGFTKCIEKVLSIDVNVLDKIGLESSKFVHEEKNAKKATEKIFNLWN